MTACPMCTKWHDESDLRIIEFDRCYVTLNRDQFFPGYCFVFTKAHVTELFHLDPATRGAVIEEVNRVAAALAAVFTPAKINYELLGNMVPHVHWHVIPRFANDTHFPGAIWAPRQRETMPEGAAALPPDFSPALRARLAAALVR